jgi:hypothetical protein
LGAIATDMRSTQCPPHLDRMLAPLRDYCYQSSRQSTMDPELATILSSTKAPAPKKHYCTPPLEEEKRKMETKKCEPKRCYCTPPLEEKIEIDRARAVIGVDIPDPKFKPNLVEQKKHYDSCVICHADPNIDCERYSARIQVPKGAPVYSAYSLALVGYGPQPYGIPCDAKEGDSNFRKYFHIIQYKPEQNAYYIH